MMVFSLKKSLDSWEGWIGQREPQRRETAPGIVTVAQGRCAGSTGAAAVGRERKEERNVQEVIRTRCGKVRMTLTSLGTR